MVLFPIAFIWLLLVMLWLVRNSLNEPEARRAARASPLAAAFASPPERPPAGAPALGDARGSRPLALRDSAVSISSANAGSRFARRG